MGRKIIKDKFTDDQKIDRKNAVHYRFTQHNVLLFSDLNLIDKILDSQDEKKISYIQFQHEIGEDTKKLHIQGYLQIGVGYKLTRANLLRYKSASFLNGADVRICDGSADDNIAYVSKEATAVPNTKHMWGELRPIKRRFERGNTENRYCHMSEDANTLTHRQFIEKYSIMGGKLTAMETLDEYFLFYRKPYVNDMINKYGDLLPWHKQIVDIIKGPPDDRYIYWIYDPTGKNAKTEICKFLDTHRNDYKAVAFQNASSRNLSFLFKQAYLEQPDFRAVLLYIQKSMCGGDYEKINYTLIEALKDGWIQSDKYKCQTIMCDRPHVIVMSNDLPNFKKLIADRWKVFTIEDNNLQSFNISSYL